MRWTRARRSKLHGVRARHEADPPDILLSPADAWAALRQLQREVPACFAAASAHEAGLRHVLADLASDAVPEVVPEVEGHRLALTFRRGEELDWMNWESQRPARALVGLWAAAGPETLIQLMTSGAAPFATEMAVRQIGEERRVEVRLVEPDPSSHAKVSLSTTWPQGLQVEHRFLWTALRCHAGQLDDDAFAELDRAAWAARESSDDWTRIALAFALSRNPAHAQAEIARLDQGATAPPGSEWLLLAAPNVATAERLYRAHWSQTILTQLSYDLVESFGTESERLLEAILAFAAPSAYSGSRHTRATLKLIAKGPKPC